MEVEIRVREATSGDLPTVLRLLAQLPFEPPEGYMPTPSEASKIFLQMLATPDRKLLVAEDPMGVAGIVDLLVVSNLTHGGSPWTIVENLVVDSDRRRNGIGQALMREVIERARRAGCYKVQLMSNVRREGAHDFYRSLGFEENAQGFRLYFE